MNRAQNRIVDTHNVQRRYANALSNLKNNTSVSAENKKTILNFLEDCELIDKISKTRVVKCAILLKHMAIWLKKDFKKATAEDIKKQIIKRLAEGDRSVYSIQDYSVLLKRFYSWLYKLERGTYPEQVSWVKVKKIKPEPPKYILSEDDVLKLVGGCDNSRDKALLMLLYETGGRIDEILNLNISDVDFSGALPHATFHVSKTEQRVVPFRGAAQYVLEWLNAHPQKTNPDAPLWVCKEYVKGGRPRNSDEYTYAPMRYEAIYQILRRLKKRLNFKKPVNPHIFRKSRATFLASNPNMNEALLCSMFGWRLGSPVARHYVTVSGKALDNAIKTIYGDMKQEEIEKKRESIFKNHDCWRCKNSVKPSDKFCKQCGATVDTAYIEETTAKIQESALMEDKSVKTLFTEMLKNQKEYQKKLFELENKLKIRQEQPA